MASYKTLSGYLIAICGNSKIKASCNPAEKLYNRYKKQTGGESDDDT